MTEPEGPRSGPAPQYGEYASAEEQRAAIRTPAPSPASPSDAAASATASPSALPTGTRPPARPMRPTTRAARPSRRADRLITLLLLVYGLVTVVSTVTQLWHFADFAELWMRFAGIDAEFTNIAQGDLWGRIGAGILILGWLATALLSGWMIARSRLAWWIPLVGAILTYAVLTVCLMVPLANDPAIAAHLVR
ncbi:DUF6264 family protein [Microbacterium flavum]|uniref:DUF6264 family protein n=1 Tax=Microbacterium flavum TaxID=415216 RepID=UPI0024AD985D|nr:DUF6264 family protein [Microbacterium flavum]